MAAGASQRMKFPKPLLRYEKEKTFVQKIIEEYKKLGCDEKILVVNKELKEQGNRDLILELGRDTKLVINDRLELERFYSVKLGMQALNKCEYCFIQNCDNPFVDEGLLRILYENRIRDGYLVPVYRNKGGHPVLVGSKIIDFIKNEAPDESNLKDVLKNFTRKNIEAPNEKVLININTPEDYRKYFK